MTQHDTQTCDDISLARSAKEGDMAAFEKLVTRHSSGMFRVAMHILGSREDAEDVIQESFLRAFQNLNQFEERARFSTWLTRIVLNSSLMKLRALRRTTVFSLDKETEDGNALIDTVSDWRPNPEQRYRETELKEILLHALASLSEACRIVFVLRDIEGLSTTETAEMLGLNISNVKSRLLRARLRLRAKLSAYFESYQTDSVHSGNAN